MRNKGCYVEKTNKQTNQGNIEPKQFIDMRSRMYHGNHLGQRCIKSTFV